jgi:hypothetical protein
MDAFFVARPAGRTHLKAKSPLRSEVPGFSVERRVGSLSPKIPYIAPAHQPHLVNCSIPFALDIAIATLP